MAQHPVGLIEKSRGEITGGHHKPCSEAAHQSVNNSGLLKSRALFKSQQVNIENPLGQAIAWLNERCNGALKTRCSPDHF